jgi:hypothetical protein
MSTDGLDSGSSQLPGRPRAELGTEVATHKDDEGREPTGRASCAECGASFAGDQRYCLRCGARRGDLPAAIAAGIVASRAKGRTGAAAAGAAATPGGAPEGAPQSVAAAAALAAAAAAGGAGGGAGSGSGTPPAGGPEGEESGGNGLPAWMPSRQAAAIAVFAMLALGVVLGSATSQFADSAPVSTIVLDMPHHAAPAPEPEEAEEEPEEEVAEAPAPEPEPEAEVAAAPVPEVIEEAAPPVEEVPPPVPFNPEEGAEEPELVEPPEEEGLPEVKHAFVIVLGDNGYEELFGKTSAAKYLAKELPKKGELIPNYYAVASGSLANQIALISGQGPTPETALNCPTYADILPGTVSAEGQVEGNGCVYPKTVETLPNQLKAAGDTWRAYVEDIDHGVEAGQPIACRHPLLGSPDPSPLPLPGDAYETWRNPFVFFHSIVDKAKECEENDVGLEKLAYDLRTAKKTPTLSYIVPNACHSGGEVPCEEGQPTGALAVEAFLRKVVPAIMGSDAYQEGGLIAITSAQAPQLGEHADLSACCVVPEYPNLPPAAAPPVSKGAVKTSGGGGRVGMLLISPFVKAGTVAEESLYYNHFTFLLTLEELFGLEKLGYAAEPALLPFESGETGVFNAAAAEKEESTATGEEESTSVSEEEEAKEEKAKRAKPSPALRRLLRWSKRPISRSRSAARSAVPGPAR